MPPSRPPRGRCCPPETPPGAAPWYALDRRPPLAAVWNRLAYVKGNLFRAQRLMNWVRPRVVATALGGWLVHPGLPESGRPFLLCPARAEPQAGLPLLLAEWMESRRGSGDGWDLVVRSAPDVGSLAAAFDFVRPLWELVQALKRQLGVPRSDVLVSLGPPDDAEGEALFDAADGVVACSLRPEGDGTLEEALRRGKPVAAPCAPGLLPTGQPFGFAVRPAALRFVGTPRRAEGAEEWLVPEPFALAGALRRLTAGSGVVCHGRSGRADEGRVGHLRPRPGYRPAVRVDHAR